MIPVRFQRVFPALSILLLVSLPLTAQEVVQEDTVESQSLMADVTLDRLFGSDFRGDILGATRWLDGGSGYTTLENAEGGGRERVMCRERIM